MINDDGTGFQQPMMINKAGDVCIFDAGDIYEVKKKHEGVIKKIDKKTVKPAFWKELEKDGWKNVDY